MNSPSIKSKLLLSTALCCLGLIPSFGFAQGKGYGIEVRNISPSLQETLPGQILSPSVRITNATAKQENLQENILLPANWQALLAEAVFPLAPGEATTRIIAFQIPSGTPAGDYHIAYFVRSQRDYAVQDQTEFTVRVLPTSKLAVWLESRPNFAIAGDKYQVKVRLINQGNSSLECDLKAESEASYPAHINPAHLVLQANESAVATLEVETNAQEKIAKKQMLKVLAVRAGEEKVEILGGLTLFMDIIPRLSEALDLNHKMPATLTLRANGKNDRQMLQTELRGGGRLEEFGNRTLDFLLRFPDAQKTSILGLRDEYLLNYSDDSFALRLGDQGYGLSPLTDYFRYGRGIEFNSGKPAGYDWKAYHLLGRWDSGTEVWGTRISRNIDRCTKVSINLLDKDTQSFDTGEKRNDRIWSIAGSLQPNLSTDLQLEYARGFSDREEGVSDDAYRFEFRKSGKRGGFQFTKVHAEPNYFGYYSNADYNSGVLTFPFDERLRGRVSFRTWSQNLNRREALDIAPRELLASAGLSYKLPNNYSLALDFDWFHRQDALTPAAFHYSETPISLSINHSSSRYSLRLDYRTGRQHDALSGKFEQVQQYGIFAYYRPSRKQSISLYCTFGDKHSLAGSYLLGSRDNVGFAFSLAPSERLSLRFNYLNYGFAGSQKQQQKEFFANYLLPKGQYLTFRARRTEARFDGNKFAYILEYSRPFDLNLGKKQSVGAAAGRVFTADAPNKSGLSNVILRINELTAVTDKAGRYAFPSLPPGNYALRIDKASIGLNRVPLDKQPILITVKAGEITTADTAITEAARITGSIAILDKPESLAKGNGAVGEDAQGTVFVVGTPQDKKSIAASHNTGQTNDLQKAFAGVLVELQDGKEVIRTLTDSEGKFIFDGIRPARWQLKVYDYNLPDFHYLDKSEMDLNLAPGEAKSVNLFILPKTRPIRIIDEGKIASTSVTR
jgi:hypothetical protein